MVVVVVSVGVVIVGVPVVITVVVQWNPALQTPA